MLNHCEAKRDIELENSGIRLVQAKRDLHCSGLILTNFACGNSINAGCYFVLFLWATYALIILRSWMFTIIMDLSVIFWNLGF